MQNPIIEMLMNQLRMQNPQIYQQVSQMRNNNMNPQDLIQQVIGQATPQQVQDVFIRAKQLGVPESILAQIQNTNR